MNRKKISITKKLVISLAILIFIIVPLLATSTNAFDSLLGRQLLTIAVFGLIDAILYSYWSNLDVSAGPFFEFHPKDGRNQ